MAWPLGSRVSGVVLAPLLVLAVALGAVQYLAGSGSAAVAPGELAESAADATLGKLPLFFVENRGQVDDRAEYYLPGKDTSVFFTRDGLRMSLTGRGVTAGRYGLGLDFVGARPGARPVGRARTPAVVSYFKGAPADWKAGVPTFSEVAYPNLWPGIDLVYSGSASRLKYSFLVRPGADPAAIQLAWQGATGTRLGKDGQLEVSTPAGVLRDEAPYSYQVVGGRRVKVESSYALSAANGYGFTLGDYDRSRPLVIDPAMLVYAGFIGGSGDETINNVDLDGAGNLYVTGTSSSPDFPATVGPDPSLGGGLSDGFVAKVRADGSGLVYAGYIGGSDFDNPINIAVDGAGAAYVSGSTGSSESEGFPAIVGPDVTYNGGPQDAFVVKVRPNGTSLDYAGFIGGAGGPGDSPADPNEQANGIDVDAAGNAYLAGFTKSDQSTFPDGDGFGAIPGYDKTFNSFVPPIPDPPVVPDAWSAKVNAAGTALLYATYIGGGNSDAATGLTVDPTGVYVNLFTSSNEDPQGMTNPVGGFPITPGSFDTTFNGPDSPGPLGLGPPVDAGAVKLNTAGTALIYSTYIGGAGVEQPFGNTVDGAGNAYITGRTNSDQSSFPDGDGFGGIPGFDRVLNAGPSDPAPDDAFVVKLNAAGSALNYATYIGGSGNEVPIGIDLDATQSAHIAGSTGSTETTFPVTNGPDSTYNGGPGDAFVARLNPLGTALEYSGYIGGALDDRGLGMAVDGAGNAYTAGSTDSDQCSGFPVTVGPDLTFNGPFGSTEAFVAKISPTGAGAGPRPSPPPGCGSATAPPPPAVPAFAGCPSLTATVIQGSAASNAITGTLRADRIFAGRGDDTVDGLAGDDCIDLGEGTDRGQGGSGSDLLLGGIGRDRLAGSSENDRLHGGPGNDRLNGGSGSDRAIGDSGKDLIAGNFGNDVLQGAGGNDRLSGSRGRDRITGGSGKDLISGGSSGDRVVGSGGNDRINGNSGNDSIRGNSGSDRLNGSTGRDRLSGGSGNDRILARDRRGDRISCGRGRDTVLADSLDRVARDCERVSRLR